MNTGSAGLLDGVTIIAGHEYAETVTDPFVDQTGYYAWFDKDGAENGDKCAWKAQYNAHFSTGTFAVQSTWSNYYRLNWATAAWRRPASEQHTPQQVSPPGPGSRR